MTYQPNDIELQQLIERYVAQGSERDPDRRRKLVRQVWAIDAVQVLVNPPREITGGAAHHGIAYPSLTVTGHDAFDARVGRAYELWVAPGRYVFDLKGASVRRAGAGVTFSWVMRELANAAVAGPGFDVLTFADDARIRTDHQYVA
jgi:hypothetical protein